MNETNFDTLGLEPAILRALSEKGYEKPTPIQAAAIPSLLEGRDLLGCAQTGTGKTAAFALPIIQLLSGKPARILPKSVRVLVVAPTRELAAQIDESFADYAKHMKLSRACVFGGVGKSPQEKALVRGVDVLTATPGRLLDLHGEGKLRLDAVEIVVLDEADRMLDMGFIKDVRRIVALLPRERQTLLFSATMPPSIAELASTILRKPVRIDISPESPTVELIDQSIIYAEKNDKRHLLAAIIDAAQINRALVFTRTKHGADRLVRSLEKAGIASAAIHANKSQNNRTRALESFRSGKTRILVATDLAARGIDVDGITHVFNFELPNEPETYVHRIGRTARAGADGIAIAFCDNEEKSLLRDIERLIGKKIPTASGPLIDEAYKAAAKARAAEALNPPEPEGRGRPVRGRSGSVPGSAPGHMGGRMDRNAAHRAPVKTNGSPRNPPATTRNASGEKALDSAKGAKRGKPGRGQSPNERTSKGQGHDVVAGKMAWQSRKTVSGEATHADGQLPSRRNRANVPTAADERIPSRGYDPDRGSRDADRRSHADSIRNAIRDIARGEDGILRPEQGESRPRAGVSHEAGQTSKHVHRHVPGRASSAKH
jgi:ATP-dependent RNA helicase RhlE